MLLLDADILIDVERRHPPALDWFSKLTEVPSVPGFVVMELLQDAADSQQLAKTLKLLAPLPVVWPSKSDCERALSLLKAFRLSHRIGLLDSLIASTALGRSATLCTFNRKHYQMIQGLHLQEPYTR